MYENELKAALSAAVAAGELIMGIYATPFGFENKEDGSPVTEADKKADALIREMLHKATPRAAFLTEESSDDKRRLKKEYVWIVDPLDGTKDFVEHDGNFAVNIALARNGEVVVGVIYLPVDGLTYYAVKGEGSYRRDKDGKISLIRVNSKKDRLTVLSSRYHKNAQEEALIKKHRSRIAYEAYVGASGKFCAIAEGQAEVSFRMSDKTKEWDVAAGDLILREAGGVCLQTDLTPFSYNKDDVYNRKGYILANCVDNLLL